jgi:hypothetical protein
MILLNGAEQTSGLCALDLRTRAANVNLDPPGLQRRAACMHARVTVRKRFATPGRCVL